MRTARVLPRSVSYDDRYNSSEDTLPLPSASSSVSSSSSSSSSSLSVEERDPFNNYSSRHSRLERPRLADRQKSSSLIVPKGQETVRRPELPYPPNDARGMSPRRNDAEVQKLEAGVRKSLQDRAQTLQSSLAALAQKVDEVKLDHDKLETENRFLQEYIGGLTRNVSKETNLGRSGSLRKGKK